MKAFKRSTEVKEAITVFEQSTGKKVIKAKRFQGSMKGYVQFIYQGSDNEFIFVQKDRFLNKERFLGQCRITFERDLSWIGGKFLNKMAVEVRWEDLGMSYNNAYQPSLRKIERMFT